jgi:hypothetical protein
MQVVQHRKSKKLNYSALSGVDADSGFQLEITEESYY